MRASSKITLVPTHLSCISDLRLLNQVNSACRKLFLLNLCFCLLLTLMALCDQLEQQLNQADQQRRRLLEALLAEALGGRLPTEEESHATVA